MTIRYVASTGSNTSPYDTWAKAATDLMTVTALMGAGDITYMLNNAAASTYAVSKTVTIAGTLANPAMLISTSDTTNNPPTSVATGASIDLSATNAIALSVTGKCNFYGVTFKTGGSVSGQSLNIGTTDDDMLQLESCSLAVPNTGAGYIDIGNTGGGGANARIITRGCTFTLGNNASQNIQCSNLWESYGDTFLHTTTQPTNLFKPISSNSRACIVHMEGADLSDITNTLISATSGGASRFEFYGCKLGSANILATQTGPGHTEAWVFDCNTGNVHYSFAHYNYWGNTTVSAAIYHNDATNGASYDIAGDKHSWLITGVNGTYATPYVSPWIDVYNEATAAVTPRLEILRDGTASAYNDDQVWGEYSAKVTASSTRSTIVNDRRGLVASAAAQAAGAGTGTWTGGTTPYSMKLEPTSTITPAVIGHIRARVCVAGAISVYVNPKILGV